MHSPNLVAIRLSEKGIKRVLLVDDAFDSPRQSDFTHNELADFWNELELDSPEQQEALQEPLKSIPASEDEIDDAYVAALYDQRDNLGPLQEAYDRHLMAPLGEKHGHLDPLIEELENLGLEVVSIGTEVTDNPGEVQLIFLDYYLGDAGDDAAVEAARAAVRDLLTRYPAGSEKPIVVLMSSRDDVNRFAEEFRGQTDIVGGMFYFVPKSDLIDRAGLLLNLDMLAMARPHGHLIQKFMDTIESKIEEIVSEFLTDIKRLNLDDYVYIQRLSLQADGHPLGDYLLWLYSAYFGHLLFERSLGTESRELDKMTFGDWIPSQLIPSTQLTAMYHAALFDTTVGPLGPHPRQPKEVDEGELPHQKQGASPEQEEKLSASQDAGGNALVNGKNGKGPGDDEAEAAETLPYFNMGDIFQRSETAELLMVCNPACDLEFTPDGKRSPKREDSILFIPGTPEKLREPPSSEALRTELFLYKGENHRVLWQPKRLRAIKYQDVEDWLSGHGFVRVARLRMPFSLEIQQHFASNLTRVGVPVPPPFYRPLQVALYKKGDDGNIERLAIAESLNVAFAIATHRREEKQRDKEKCVFTTGLVRILQKSVSEIASQVPFPIEGELEEPERKRRERANKRIERARQLENDVLAWREVSELFAVSIRGESSKLVSEGIEVGRNVPTDGPWESKALLMVHISESQPPLEPPHAPAYEEVP